MSIRQIDRVWKNRELFGLAPSESAVLVRFAALPSKIDNRLFPTLSDISDDIGYSESTIQRAIKVLLEKNLLLRISEYSPREQRPNIYKVNVEKFFSPKKEDA
jgi:DNA-binding MarR family transcriptional regulator